MSMRVAALLAVGSLRRGCATMRACAVLNTMPTMSAVQVPAEPMSLCCVTGVSWTCRVAVGIVGFGRAVLVEERVDVGRVMKPIVVVDLCLGRTRGEIDRNDETNDDGSWTEHLPSLSLAWFAAGVSDVRNRRRETVGHPLGGSRSPHPAPVPVDKKPKSYDKDDGWSGFLGPARCRGHCHSFANEKEDPPGTSPLAGNSRKERHTADQVSKMAVSPLDHR